MLKAIGSFLLEILPAPPTTEMASCRSKCGLERDHFTVDQRRKRKRPSSTAEPARSGKQGKRNADGRPYTEQREFGVLHKELSLAEWHKEPDTAVEVESPEESSDIPQFWDGAFPLVVDSSGEGLEQLTCKRTRGEEVEGAESKKVKSYVDCERSFDSKAGPQSDTLSSSSTTSKQRKRRSSKKREKAKT